MLTSGRLGSLARSDPDLVEGGPVGVDVAKAFAPILKRVQTRTMTICTEAKINIKMSRNGFRMHLPKANNT